MVNDANDICKVVWDYFHNLFKSEASSHNEFNLNYIQKSVSQDVHNMMARQFTDDEILEAFNQMDPRKAPEIDGLSVFSLKRIGKLWVKMLLIFVMIF